MFCFSNFVPRMDFWGLGWG